MYKPFDPHWTAPRTLTLGETKRLVQKNPAIRYAIEYKFDPATKSVVPTGMCFVLIPQSTNKQESK